MIHMERGYVNGQERWKLKTTVYSDLSMMNVHPLHFQTCQIGHLETKQHKVKRETSENINQALFTVITLSLSVK